MVAVARHQPIRAWYAATYAPPPRRFAGRGWSFHDGDLTGIFDMDHWEPFRRRGSGKGQQRAVCPAAGQAGARHAVMRATPQGRPAPRIGRASYRHGP